MPTVPSAIQSFGTADTYRLKDGRTVELRNGCLVDSKTRVSITGSLDTARFLLANALLTDEQRMHWEAFGKEICRCGSGPVQILSDCKRHWKMGSLSGKEAA